MIVFGDIPSVLRSNFAMFFHPFGVGKLRTGRLKPQISDFVLPAKDLLIIWKMLKSNRQFKRVWFPKQVFALRVRTKGFMGKYASDLIKQSYG